MPFLNLQKVTLKTSIIPKTTYLTTIPIVFVTFPVIATT